MAHTAVRPATTWGPAVQNIYCLYMVGTWVRTSPVMNDRLCCCFRFKAFHGVRYKDTKPVKGFSVLRDILLVIETFLQIKKQNNKAVKRLKETKTLKDYYNSAFSWNYSVVPNHLPITMTVGDVFMRQHIMFRQLSLQSYNSHRWLIYEYQMTDNRHP